MIDPVTIPCPRCRAESADRSPSAPRHPGRAPGPLARGGSQAAEEPTAADAELHEAASVVRRRGTRMQAVRRPLLAPVSLTDGLADPTPMPRYTPMAGIVRVEGQGCVGHGDTPEDRRAARPGDGAGSL